MKGKALYENSVNFDIVVNFYTVHLILVNDCLLIMKELQAYRQKVYKNKIEQISVLKLEEIMLPLKRREFSENLFKNIRNYS